MNFKVTLLKRLWIPFPIGLLSLIFPYFLLISGYSHVLLATSFIVFCYHFTISYLVFSVPYEIEISKSKLPINLVFLVCAALSCAPVLLWFIQFRNQSNVTAMPRYLTDISVLVMLVASVFFFHRRLLRVAISLLNSQRKAIEARLDQSRKISALTVNLVFKDRRKATDEELKIIRKYVYS